MKYRRLGNSTLSVSEVGFGCMSLGFESSENAQLVAKAIASGINFFDTADIYDHGRNESMLGAAVKRHRHQVILATKVGNQWRPDGQGLTWNPRKKHILSSIEGSLVRLQTDYVDLYQLHGGTIDDPIDEIVETFEFLQTRGKIRFYGISSIRPNVIRQFAERSKISSVMLQYSLLDRRAEESCLRLLENNGISVLARGAVAKGLLINKPSENYLNYSAQEVQLLKDVIDVVTSVCGNKIKPALEFVLANRAVASAVVGIRTGQQLAEILEATRMPSLSGAQMESLKNVLKPSAYDQHR